MDVVYDKQDFLDDPRAQVTPTSSSAQFLV